HYRHYDRGWDQIKDLIKQHDAEEYFSRLIAQNVIEQEQFAYQESMHWACENPDCPFPEVLHAGELPPETEHLISLSPLNMTTTAEQLYDLGDMRRAHGQEKAMNWF